MEERNFRILAGTALVPATLWEWAEWMETGDRVVGNDVVGKSEVSTVCLGLNHGFGLGKDLWFETMVFGGKAHNYQRRYETLEEALEGHRIAVEAVKQLNKPFWKRWLGL